MSSDQLPPARHSVLESLKQRGPSTISDLAERLGITGEAVRQHLLRLQRAGLVKPERKASAGQLGRPAVVYRLTSDGENLFPKAYDELGMALLDAVQKQLGPDAQRKVLNALTDEKVKVWESKLAGMDLKAKMEALRNFYLSGDPYIEVGEDERGPFLIEKNCPYLQVADHRPALCSVTVNAIARLLGCRVVREQRPQSGDGRCLLRVRPDQPLDASLAGAEIA